MNNLRNNLLLYYDFYIVGKAKSFTKAAEYNSLSQSNLSRSVQSLEEQLRLKLIDRNNKGLMLTIDGEKLYQKLDEIFTSYDQFNNSFFGDELIGEITIGTTRNIADNKLLKYLLAFNEKFSNVKVKILTDNAYNLNEYLMQHKIDILVDYLPHINYSEKLETEIIPIGDFQTCFACSRETYSCIEKSVKTLNDLKKCNLVIPGSSRRRQILDEVLQINNVHLEPKILMPDSRLMAEFVSETDFVGYFVTEEIEDLNLVKIPLKESMPVNVMGLIYLKNTINNIAKTFVDLVLELSKN